MSTYQRRGCHSPSHLPPSLHPSFISPSSTRRTRLFLSFSSPFLLSLLLLLFTCCWHIHSETHFLLQRVSGIPVPEEPAGPFFQPSLLLGDGTATAITFNVVFTVGPKASLSEAQSTITVAMEGGSLGSVTGAVCTVAVGSTMRTCPFTYTPAVSDLSSTIIITASPAWSQGVASRSLHYNVMLWNWQATLTPPVWGGGSKPGTVGSSTLYGYANGPMATVALFNQIGKGVLDSTGKIMYIPDIGNNVIRKWDIETDEVTTLWGPEPTPNKPHILGVGGLSATAVYGEVLDAVATPALRTSPTFRSPHALAISSDNTRLYISDYMNCMVREMLLSPAGVPLSLTQITGYAGCDGAFMYVDHGAGAATNAILPSDLVLDESRSPHRILVLLNIRAFPSDGTNPSLMEIQIDAGNQHPSRLLTAELLYILAHDTLEPQAQDLASRGMIGSVESASMVLSRDSSTLFILAPVTHGKRTSPNGDPLFLINEQPAVLRVYRIAEEALNTKLSFFYQPTERLWGSAEDGFPSGTFTPESTKRLVSAPHAIALSLDERFLYFLDGFMGASSSQSRMYNTFSCIGTEASSSPGAHCGVALRKMDLVTGEITTLAGGFASNADGVGSQAGIWNWDSRDGADMSEKKLGRANSLLMHPSGDFLYIFEANSNSRIRAFYFETNEIKTIGGGGCNNPSVYGVGPSRTFGTRGGLGPHALYSSPSLILNAPNGLDMFVADAYAISKISLVTGVSQVIQVVKKDLMRSATTSGVGASYDTIPYINPYYPLVIDNFESNTMWAFQMMSGSESRLYKINTLSPDLPPMRIMYTGSGYSASTWSGSGTTQGRPLSMAMHPNTALREIFVSDVTTSTVSGTIHISRIIRLKLSLISVDGTTGLISEIAHGLSTALGNPGSQAGIFGILTSIQFDTTASFLYAVDVAYYKVIKISLPGGVVSIVAGTDEKKIKDGTTGATTSFAFDYETTAVIEQRGRAGGDPVDVSIQIHTATLSW